MKLWTALLGLCLLSVASPVRADRLDEAFTAGNQAYARGDLKAAVAAFEQLHQQGIVSDDLYYNLGVAYFRQGSLGRAIWAFERALTLEPDSDDARFNLAQAQKLVARRVHDKIEGIEKEALWIRLVTVLPTSAQVWLFLLIYLAFFALLFLRRRADDDARAPLTAGAAILGVAALLGGALLVGRVALTRMPFGVVLPDSLSVKEGANVSHRTSFEIHAGLKVRLLEDEHDWVRVRLANGLEGWVRGQDIGRL